MIIPLRSFLKQDSSARSAPVLAVLLISLRLITLQTPKANTQLAAGSQIWDWGNNNTTTTLNLFTESIELRASNEGPSQKSQSSKDRNTHRRYVTVFLHTQSFNLSCPQSWMRSEEVDFTFNGSRSVESAEPSSVLYLHSLSLWSMVV